LTEFEEIYSPSGLWVKLFRKAEGYQGTELLREPNSPYRYITIDWWASSQAYESFLLHWKSEYAALEAQCEGLAEKESPLGKWESISSETR
jgi:heme-degrading monooxygenase HmoA